MAILKEDPGPVFFALCDAVFGESVLSLAERYNMKIIFDAAFDLGSKFQNLILRVCSSCQYENNRNFIVGVFVDFSHNERLGR